MTSRSTRTAYATGKRAHTEADIAAAVDAFRRILRELRLVARKTELATGLTAAQLFVLSTVADAPGCSVNEVATATMTDRSSVVAVIDRLVENGYLTREPSHDDRRRASIEITSRGRRAIRQTPPSPTTLLVSALRSVPPKELSELSAGLVSLTRAMGLAHAPAGMFFEETPGARRNGATKKVASASGRRRAR